jgi:FMN phosphatase YigB (HAD superfamily)
LIELYVFDEGGVLIRNHMVLGAVAAAMGMERDALRELLPPDMRLLSDGEIGSAEFWRRFEARTGIRPERNWWAECFRPTRDEPTFELVRELAEGARVVCGTNTIDCHHEINEREGMYAPFHAVYASHLIHRSKPDPRFWEAILEAEGAAPEKAFFADDSEANVEAAAALGMVARIYVDAPTLRADLLALGAPLKP